jgi:hypothetical protein
MLDPWDRNTQGLCLEWWDKSEETTRQTVLCPFTVDEAAVEILWDVQETSKIPRVLLGSMMTTAPTSLRLRLGDPRPLPSPRNSALSPRAGIWPLDSPQGHNGALSQNPGKHRPCRERTDSCWTQSFQCNNLDQGTHGGKDRHSCPSVCLARSLPLETIPCKGS